MDRGGPGRPGDAAGGQAGQQAGVEGTLAHLRRWILSGRWHLGGSEQRNHPPRNSDGERGGGRRGGGRC